MESKDSTDVPGSSLTHYNGKKTHPTINDGNPYNGELQTPSIGLSFPSPMYGNVMGV